MTTYDKRPGFAREVVAPQDVSVTNNVTTDISSTPTKTQQASLQREMLKVELLKDIRTELRRISFLLENIAGIDIPAEVFEDESDY